MSELDFSLQRNLALLEEMFGHSVDFYAKPVQLCGVEAAVVLFDGITELETLWRLLMTGVAALEESGFRPRNGPQLYDRILLDSSFLTEPKPVDTMQQAVERLTGGLALLFVEGCNRAIAFSVQGMKARSVEQPGTEGNIRGSREGFTDLLRVNLSLLRRLIRTENLTIETGFCCSTTHTEYALCYDKRRVDERILCRLKERLAQAEPVMLLDSSYLVPWISPKRLRLFSPVGYTERPAVGAAKICEGKILLLVNGSPSAMILPYLFAEHFDSLDDYGGFAYFASFMRILKYLSFYVTILFPGSFVAAALYTPELLPSDMLARIAEAERSTPLPLFAEMLLVIILLEMIREAGLRMPQSLGHSVNLVAALIIGDVAVSTGILSMPCILVGAVTSISMFLTPSLYEPETVLRMFFLAAGGIAGPMGIVFGVMLLLLELTRMELFGVPFAGELLPLQDGGVRDGLLRINYKTLSKQPYNIREAMRDETK